jgi:prevent-host-death family protein
MQTQWQLQEAKNKLSQLIKLAAEGEPQTVTVYGKPTAVIVSAEEYARLTRPPAGKLSAALLAPDNGIAWLGKVEQRFADRTLPLDTATLRTWAQLTGSAELAGRRLPVLDALLMATAQCHGLTIVTRNVQDSSLFPHVFNPWAS